MNFSLLRSIGPEIVAAAMRAVAATGAPVKFEIVDNMTTKCVSRVYIYELL